MVPRQYMKKTASNAAVSVPLSIALPYACEVSWRARAWKCPILKEFAPVTWVPRIRTVADLGYK